MKKYEGLRDSLKTGDIVLFSGKGGISHGIKLITGCKWSHVGMILRFPTLKAVFLWESTTLTNLKDAIDGKKKRGVQLVFLSDRLLSYDGEVAIRRLENSNISPHDYDELMNLREEIRNRPYEEDKLELIKAAYDGPFGQNEMDLSSLFCSELVAEAYQRLGLLNKDLPSNEYTPSDFSEKKQLKLLKGANFGDEIIMKY